MPLRSAFGIIHLLLIVRGWIRDEALVGLVPLLCLRGIRFGFLNLVAFTVVLEPQGNVPFFLGGVNVLA
jgi:hypothetical protein